MQNKYSDQSVYLNNGNGNGNGAYVYSLPIVQQNTVEEDEESLDLRQLLNVFKHRLRLIMAVTVGVTSAAILWTLIQEPQYRGSFQLLVESPREEQKTNALSDPLALLQGGNLTTVDYDSQIEVLASPSVLEPIIEKLQVKYPDLHYKKLINKTEPLLTINQVRETKILTVTYEDNDPEKVQFVLDNLSNDYLRYSLEERRLDISQGIDFVKQQLPRVHQKVDDLQEQVQTFRQRYNLLEPTEQATILAEKSAEQEEKYFETQVKLKETKSLYNLLEKQLSLNPEQAIASSYLSESPRYQNLLDQLQEIEVQLANESARFLPSSPVIQGLQAKKEELLPLLQQEAVKVLGKNYYNFANESDSLASPSSLRLELNKQYIQAANEIEILEIRLQALEDSLNKLNKLTKQMPVIARQYTDLQRQLTIATASLDRFLEAEEKLQLESAQQSIPWQLIAKPLVLPKPVSPNHTRDIALGMIGGLLLGIASALIAERLDPVFHSTEELKESIPLPLLGTIPLEKELEPLEAMVEEEEAVSLPQLQIGERSLSFKTATTNQSKKNNNSNGEAKWYTASPFLEAFRSLNTNIKLLGSDSPINSIVVSSSVPSEGKSTISSHLAQAAAAMGQRVLLIDADLRRPQVHRWVGLKNKEGLSNVLATGLDIETVICGVPHWDNLSVVTAGDIPPDPTRLLSSKRMQELMEQLKLQHNYDLIIYDTPPILGFADGRILASRTNGVVLVVRMGKTDRSLLKQNIDNLKVSHVPVLGIVANQVNRGSSNSYHYYTHYYGKR
jgi:capsular exopolysaccharide synthesis family protein